jgi:membrane-bound lytic murein transglycosylase MltF
MAPQKKSLAEGMQAFKRGNAAIVKQPDQLSEKLVETPETGKYYRLSREGKKTISTKVDPAVKKQFKQLMVELETNEEALVHEALNMIFEKYGRPQIAPKRSE